MEPPLFPGRFNIAEGCGRESNVDFARLLQIAAGSASELEYQLLLAHDLGFITPDDHARLSADAVEVKRMLSSFMAYLRTPQRGRARHQVRDARIDEPGYLTPDT